MIQAAMNALEAQAYCQAPKDNPVPDLDLPVGNMSTLQQYTVSMLQVLCICCKQKPLISAQVCLVQSVFEGLNIWLKIPCWKKDCADFLSHIWILNFNSLFPAAWILASPMQYVSGIGSSWLKLPFVDFGAVLAQNDWYSRCYAETSPVLSWQKILLNPHRQGAWISDSTKISLRCEQLIVWTISWCGTKPVQGWGLAKHTLDQPR